MTRWPRFCLVVMGFALFGTEVSALDLQLHLRSGLITTSFTGAQSGDFSLITSVDGEFEIFISESTSIYANAIIALDPAEAQYRYLFAGGGQKLYFLSKGRTTEIDSDVGSLSMSPKRRFFAGWQLGISQLILDTPTPALTVQSTLFEYGFNIGALYRVLEKTNVEFQFTATRGTGISSVTVDATVFRFFAGLSF